jgi:hypothetical protein
MKLMEDEHPEVRRVAVQGVCRVLYTYWEMIPTDKITSLLHCLFSKAGISFFNITTSVLESNKYH